MLSNVQLRANYDRNGLEATKDAQLIDSHVFFTMLFGSDRFEPFVGQLALSTMAEVWMNEGSLGVKECERMQIQREVRCALNLADVLQRYLDARDEGSFEECMRNEAQVLVNTPFGEELLHAIGWVYANKAEQWLGFHGNGDEGGRGLLVTQLKNDTKWKLQSNEYLVPWFHSYLKIACTSDGSYLNLEGRVARFEQRTHTAGHYTETAWVLLDTLTAIKDVAEASGGRPSAARQTSDPEVREIGCRHGRFDWQ